MLLTLFVAAPGMIVSSIAGHELKHAGVLSLKSFLMATLCGLTLGLLTYFLNGATNDAYIDRLYAACGRT